MQEKGNKININIEQNTEHTFGLHKPKLLQLNILDFIVHLQY